MVLVGEANFAESGEKASLWKAGCFVVLYSAFRLLIIKKRIVLRIRAWRGREGGKSGMSIVKRNAAAGEEILTGNRISSRERRIQEARQMNLLSNTFMSVALRDIPACQHVLRILLGKPELVVKEVRTQYYISKLISHDSAIDVLAEDGGRELYIAEIQRSDTVDHPRRIRFYGAMADSEFLEKGKSYDEMPELHVIYISETDIWKRGKTVYQ